MKQYSLEEYEKKRQQQNQRMKDYYYKKKAQKLEQAKALAEKNLKALKGEDENV
ncbi:MAG TPA: hypothetical protein GX708_11000 [Gallicola sp.]|nr:hypothetical protein [Gallicola sp.]